VLLIVTVGLVLAGIVLLVIGLVQDQPSFIYASMGCAVLAALTLFVFSRLARRSAASTVEAGGAGGGARPAPWAGGTAEGRRDETRVMTGPGATTEEDDVDEGMEGPAATETPARAGARTGRGPSATTEAPESTEAAVAEPEAPAPASGGDGRSRQAPEPVAAPEEPVGEASVADTTPSGGSARKRTAGVKAAAPATESGRPAPVAAGAPSAGAGDTGEGAWEEEDWEEEDWDEDFVFPIEDYDDLRVAEILPILGELEDDELIDVRDREAAGKARGTILRRIDILLGGGTDVAAGTEAAGPAAVAVEPEPAPAAPATPVAPAAPVAPSTRRPRAAKVPAPPPAAAAPPPPAAAPAPKAPRRRGAARSREPIPGYESLRVAQILPMLGELSPPDLATVEAVERAGANRATVLKRIERLRAGVRPEEGPQTRGATARTAKAAPAGRTTKKRR
jgi:hypothetical protein